ncbi:MAG: protein kinase domain-containing protein [Planctomycetota bacterium]
MPDASDGHDLHQDPLLRDAPTVHGFKVLDPVVLYARVGAGGMGAVYRGRHFNLDIDVAVKCLKPSLAGESPEFVGRFEREARLAASLRHQNVVTVMDVQQKHGLHYLVMEFVTGETARERVQRKGALAEQEALAILFGAVAGLAEAHGRGIVHRDIKPDNVLVSLAGRVKLADLGLAKASASSGQSISLASGVMGTPQYMAPEQWDSPDVGPTADVWALGAMLYFLLAGRHAIEAPTLAAMARKVQDQPFPSLRAQRDDLSDDVLALFERCVARDPAQRFADAGALSAALRPLVTMEERELADEAGAPGDVHASLVSPPPRQTLMTIRAAIESGSQPSLDPQEAPTMPSRDPQAAGAPHAPASPPRRRAGARRWLAVAAVLVLGLGGAWLAGLFDDPTDWPKVMAEAKAKRLYWEAVDMLPKPDGLDEAIDKLEECLQLMPSHELAAQPLARALDKRAEQLAATDLDGAYVAARRAALLFEADEAIQQRRRDLEAALGRRLFEGFALRAPAGNDLARSQTLLVATPKFELRGTVRSPGFRRMQVLHAAARQGAGATAGALPLGTWRDVAVVAGDFAVELEVPTVGDHTLQIALEDQRGVRSVWTRRLRVMGRELGDGRLVRVRAAPDVRYYTAAGNRMVPITARTFLMGTIKAALDFRADEAQREVVLENDFWLADTEVTRAQWRRVMGTEPWPKDGPDADDLPVTMVSQVDAMRFCSKLTELERDAGRLRDGHVYALPSEAQWELAGRGEPKPGSVPIQLALAQYAVFGSDAPSVVGRRKPAGFGLYDMRGNVAEWCVDRGRLGPQGMVQAGSVGNVEPISILGELGLHRGGWFASKLEECRIARRYAAPRESGLPTVGFRPAMVRR